MQKKAKYTYIFQVQALSLGIPQRSRDLFFLDIPQCHHGQGVLEHRAVRPRSDGRDSSRGGLRHSDPAGRNVHAVFHGDFLGFPAESHRHGSHEQKPQGNIGPVHKDRTHPIYSSGLHTLRIHHLRTPIHRVMGRSRLLRRVYYITSVFHSADGAAHPESWNHDSSGTQRNEIQVRIVHNHCPCQPWDADSADQIFRRHRLRNGRFGRIGRGTDTDNERILPAQAGPRHKDILEGNKQDVYNPHLPDIQLNADYPSLLRIGLLGKTDTGDSGILTVLYPAVLPFQHDGRRTEPVHFDGP